MPAAIHTEGLLGGEAGAKHTEGLPGRRAGAAGQWPGSPTSVSQTSSFVLAFLPFLVFRNRNLGARCKR